MSFLHWSCMTGALLAALPAVAAPRDSVPPPYAPPPNSYPAPYPPPPTSYSVPYIPLPGPYGPYAPYAPPRDSHFRAPYTPPQALRATRLSLAAGYAGFVRYPDGVGTDGPALLLGVDPLVSGLSRAGRSNKVQWTFGAMLGAIKDVHSDNVLTTFTPGPRLLLHIGTYASLDMRVGPSLLAQLGAQPVVGLALVSLDVGAAFRTEENGQTQLLLGFRVLGGGGYFGNAPTDCGACAGAAFATAGFETGI